MYVSSCFFKIIFLSILRIRLEDKMRIKIFHMVLIFTISGNRTYEES